MGIESICLLLVLSLATFLGACLGWKLGGFSKWHATACAAVLCLLLVWGAWISYHPSLIPEWAISPLACYLQGSWFAPLAAILFFISARQAGLQPGAATPSSDPNRLRRQNTMWGILTFVVLCAASNPLLGPPGSMDVVRDIVNARQGTPPLISPDGIVRQSLGYTCGAASCATLLRKLEIDADASEAEMVHLCMTRRWGGTTTLGMATGLKTKAVPKGWRVRIVEPDWETFLRLPKPMVCAISYNGCGHAVVVLATDFAKGVEVADPLGSLLWWPTEDFKRQFKNEAIVVYRDAVANK